jgi:hypothetical protein
MRVVVSTQWFVVRAADHERRDARHAQARLEVRADEGGVDVLDDDGLARDLARLVLDGVARPLGAEHGVRLPRGVADVDDGRADGPEMRQEIRDAMDRVRVVAAVSGGLDGVEALLHVDDDQSRGDRIERRHDHTRSMTVAVPMPAATHKVTSAVCFPVRSSSSSTVPSTMAPVAPSGCPIAMAPPFTLTRAGVEIEGLHVAQHHGREGLVDLEEIDVGLGHAGLAQGQLRHVDGGR